MANCWKNSEFNEDNLHEICRLCLSRGGIMSSIFSSPGGEKSLSITDRIMSFTAMKILKGDGLPNLICHSCLFNVERVYEFKQQCEHSDNVLRQHLMSGKSWGTFVKKELDSSDEEEEASESGENTSALSNGVHKEEIEEDSKVKTILKEDENDCSNEYKTDGNATSAEAATYPNSEDQDDELTNSSQNSCTRDENINNKEVEKPEESDLVWSGGFDNNSNLIHCPSCNKPFNNQQQFDRHQFIHTQEYQIYYRELFVLFDFMGRSVPMRLLRCFVQRPCRTEAALARARRAAHPCLHDVRRDVRRPLQPQPARHSARRGQAVPLPHLQQGLHLSLRSAQACCHTHRSPTLRVQNLQQVVHTQHESEQARTRARRQPPVRLCQVSEDVFVARRSRQTRRDPHGRKALLLSHLWPRLQSQGQAVATREAAHRGARARLQRMPHQLPSQGGTHQAYTVPSLSTGSSNYG